MIVYRRKPLIIIAIIISSLVLVAIFSLFLMPAPQSQQQKTTINNSSISRAVNLYLSRHDTPFPKNKEKPIYINPDTVKWYNESWITTSITFLDEEPRGEYREWFCIVKIEESGPNVMFLAQLDGPVDPNSLPEGTPQSLIEELTTS